MRRKKRIYWHLLPWYLGIVILAVAAASWHSSATVSAVWRRENVAALADMTRLVERELDGLSLEDGDAVDGVVDVVAEDFPAPPGRHHQAQF
jgi:hypothetical protein